MQNYLYKNIVCYQSYGRWSADYKDGATYFTLHAECTATKKQAYKIAQDMIDYLNTNK